MARIWSNGSGLALNAADLNAIEADLTTALRQGAKNPDLLITGSISRDTNGVITTAAVVWPDGTPGTFTTLAVDVSGAINSYQITYGSPTVKTYTQPTITRDSNGAATNVPAIVIS